MISTYEEYITMPESLTLEEMQSLHREIKEEVGHDRVIDCFNILERYLKKKGKSAAWREINRFLLSYGVSCNLFLHML